VPPLGLWLQAPMFVDPVVAGLSQVVFAAGRPSLLVCMQRDAVFGRDAYVVVPLTQESRVSEDDRSPRRPFDQELPPVHLVEPAPSRTDVA
jgi:hypothetical protein